MSWHSEDASTTLEERWHIHPEVYTNGHQLQAVLDKWTEALNLDAIYLDFLKAFESVPHQRLLMKLERYGICGTLLAWIKGRAS